MTKVITKVQHIPKIVHHEKKLRVVAYARVSTEKDEQVNSLNAQKDYFIKFINKNEDWEYCGIYSDKGISGVRISNRIYFNLMIEDALDDKFDLIVTKSISRFARNTVDTINTINTINTIRKLKEKGIGVYFQKEDINTLDSKGEFIITLLASFAQEESRSISENCTWGKRKSFADGKVSIPFSRFLGYDKGKEGNLVINDKQAKLIECIYSLVVLGFSISQIRSHLVKHKILSAGGKKNWSSVNIKSILTNEKYIGDALLQKSFTIDYLTKAKKKNEGELPQYYVEGNHEPIITKEIHSRTRVHLNNIKGICRIHTLGGKIVCKECGATYSSFKIHPEFKGKRGNSLAWRCKNKYSKLNKCDVRHVYDDELYKCLIRLCIERFNKSTKLKKILKDIIGRKPNIFLNFTVDSFSSDVGVIVDEIVVDKNHCCVVKWIDGKTTSFFVSGTKIRK